MAQHEIVKLIMLLIWAFFVLLLFIFLAKIDNEAHDAFDKKSKQDKI